MILTPQHPLASSLGSTLAQAGYRVEAISSREEVLGRNEPFSLLLGDARVEGLEGMLNTLRPLNPAPAVVLFGDSAALEGFLEGPAPIQGLVAEPFTPRQLRWAVEGALKQRRLLRDNRRLKALLPLYELSKGLMSEVGLGRLLDTILKLVSREMGADTVSLMLLDEARRELTIQAALGLPEEVIRTAREKVGEGIAGWVALTAQPLLLPQQAEQYPFLKAAMRRAEVTSALCLPLVAKGRVLGVLNASKKGQAAPFVQADLELLSIIGGQAAIAIENARLFESVKAQQRRVEELLQRSLLVQEEERRRVSLEIHDSVAQWLAATSYLVQSCLGRLGPKRLEEVRGDLEKVKKALAQSLRELRRIMADLHPVALQEMGLGDALGQAVEALQREGVSCQFHIEGQPTPLPSVLEIAAYRVAQEALSNISKHAAASRVSVLVSFQPELLALEVRDNGRGFNLPSVMGRAQGLGQRGLLGMRERAESLGGSLAVETAEGAGTRVLLRLPSALSQEARRAPAFTPNMAVAGGPPLALPARR